jgi:hypothetical protein
MGNVIILNKQEYKRQSVPEVGKEYHIFDDGKIRPSRHSITKVAEVIPFEEFKDEEILEAWHEEVEDCYWLFAPETDYVIRTTFEKDEDSYFVRTKSGGWFSLGFFGAQLDIDGSLYNKMIERYGEENI